MTIHCGGHGTVKSRCDLVILGKTCISNLFLGKRVFSEGTAEMVLCAEEFGACEGGAGEGVVEGFRRVFGDGFC
jgi:hypothetical protein